MHLIFDYHTHTTYSHGTGSIEENVREALTKGLKSIAITDHGPGHLTYGVKRKKILTMREEIDRLNKLFNDIEIKLGLEANIIHANGMLDVSESERKYCDIILAGYHYGVFGKNFLHSAAIHLANFVTTRTRMTMKRLKIMNTEAIIKALYNNDIHILTHPGSKGFVFIQEIAKACAETNTLMEISNSHSHLTVEEIKEAAKEDVKFVISSDAHRPEKVGEFKTGLKRVLEAGIPIERVVNLRQD